MNEETIADIVAEMRKRREMIVDAAWCAPACYSTDSMNAQIEILDKFLDRLEAAIKREREAVGNAAKTREALENSNGLLEELALIGEWSESAREQIAENNAALSAPARNCDRYQTKDSLLKAIHDDRGYLQNPIKERESVVDFILAESKGDEK